MFGKQKTCRNCTHYHHYTEKPKLNADKTLSKQQVVMDWCGNGSFELTDYRPCPQWEKQRYQQFIDPNGCVEFAKRKGEWFD